MSLFIETIRAEHGELMRLEYHQARMNATIEESAGKKCCIDLASQLTLSLPDERHRLRVLYDASGIKDVQCTPYTLRLVESLRLVASDVDYRWKRADRTELNQLFHQRNGQDDVLIVRQGLITDTSVANVAVYDGRYWLTPRTPLLKGTMRAYLLDEGYIEEADIPASELHTYPYIRLFNAMVDFGEWSFPTDNVFF